MNHSIIRLLLLAACGWCTASCEGDAGPAAAAQPQATAEPRANTRLFKVDAPKITQAPELKPLAKEEVKIHSIEGAQ